MKNKMKTSKITSKRFKVTKTGKLLRLRQNSRHLRKNKSAEQLRRFGRGATVSKAMEKTVRSLLPYSS